MISIQRTTEFLPVGGEWAFGFSRAQLGHIRLRFLLLFIGNHYWYDFAWPGPTVGSGSIIEIVFHHALPRPCLSMKLTLQSCCDEA
jgi:hypothetical protein